MGMNEISMDLSTHYEPMIWYWRRGGGHIHVRVFMNGAKCGDLCFRVEEFEMIQAKIRGGETVIAFVREPEHRQISG